MGTLLLTFTLLGYRAVRQRRFADHREWMVRSTALAFSIVTSRFWSTFLIAVYVPGALTDPNIGFGSPEIEGAAIASAWMSFIANLLFAEWWLHRKPKKRPQAQRAR